MPQAILFALFPAICFAVELAAPPKLVRAPGVAYELRGHVRDYVGAVTDNWLLRAPDANPAMLEMFRDRDKKPYRSLLPWSGEFAGKYLTAGTQVLRLTGDDRLRQYLRRFVEKLVSLQDDDGYLGPFPKDFRLTGKSPNSGDTWDAWGHYHIMVGLLLWHDLSGDAKALRCAKRIGDLLCNKFLAADKTIVSTGNAEMNQAVAHSLALLYERTGDEKYLKRSEKVIREFALEGSGDYLRIALAGGEFFQTKKPRWESLHPIMGLAELSRITGNKEYGRAYERLWWSIAKLDRHNNGGFSSGEQAQGNPYHGGAIETCCTVAWMAMSVEMLKTTGNSIVADELELSTLNQIVGLHSPTGKWCTYNTPMDGVRNPSTVDIAFQKRPGSEQLNCCSVNAARGFGLISEWGLMADRDGGLVLNWYGPGTMSAEIGSTKVTLKQDSEYPRNGTIILHVDPQRPAAFVLKLRIPNWSTATMVKLNGMQLENVATGTYCAIDREWKSGDKVTIDLDMSLRFWSGEKECAGKASIYRGPILLAYEFDKPAAAALPTLDAATLDAKLEEKRGDASRRPLFGLRLADVNGRDVRLIDYGSAGENGARYVTWLPVKNAPAAKFSPANPLRTARANP